MNAQKTTYTSQSTRLIKLESRMMLLYLLADLGIDNAKEKADTAWMAYMAMLSDLMSKAY